MRLVADTNVVFSALFADGVTRALLLADGLSVVVPEYFSSEFANHRDEVRQRTGLEESDLDLLFALLFEDVTVVPREEFSDAIPVATEALGTVDPDDVPFLALAISLDVGIWTDDDHFQRQDLVPVWRTSDLASRFQMT